MPAWAALALALWLFRLQRWIRGRRRGGTGAAMPQRRREQLRLILLAEAALWGSAIWLFWDRGVPDGLLVLVLALVVYSHWLGSALWQATSREGRILRLARRLRLKKAAADAARRVAEAASQAKTQFFAAASHDLRQPLHAMSLFAEALRRRSHDPEVAALARSLHESVDALEGLFGQLLDITRIDSGGVDVQPAPVRLCEPFARLRLHFEPIASEKGLRLTFRGDRHVAHADPVILERILRNLVSNAIRYTDAGGVLVGARPWRGGLRLQVWDSGIGIPPAALPRIFDEFVQVRRTRPLEPHPRRGLGLGLAIVRRLAALSGVEVQVRSRVGRGSVFSLELPAGRAEPAPDARPASARPTFGGRRILVIEDEPAVREALVVLLQAWGAEVQAFDSAEAVDGWLAAAPPVAPDLLITGHRLPQGRNGLQALAALRGRWPQRRLPAIVVTGHALGGHEAEAEAHDVHLLTKPVRPNRLRALVGFELGKHGPAPGRHGGTQAGEYASRT